MWYLIPAAIGGILLLTRKKEENGFHEKMELEHRRIYICHSFYDSKSYKTIVRKLKLSDDFKVWNYSIPMHKQRKVKDEDTKKRNIIYNNTIT